MYQVYTVYTMNATFRHALAAAEAGPGSTRLVQQHATTVNIRGDSYRLREQRKAGSVRSTRTVHSEPCIHLLENLRRSVT